MSDHEVEIVHKGKKIKVKVDVTPNTYRPGKDELKLMAAMLYQGDKAKVHQSKRTDGAPAGTKGYLHMYANNEIVAFGATTDGTIDNAGQVTKKAAIKVTADGSVKNGVHKFKNTY
jgi:hypothetical protein